MKIAPCRFKYKMQKRRVSFENKKSKHKHAFF